MTLKGHRGQNVLFSCGGQLGRAGGWSNELLTSSRVLEPFQSLTKYPLKSVTCTFYHIFPVKLIRYLIWKRHLTSQTNPLASAHLVGGPCSSACACNKHKRPKTGHDRALISYLRNHPVFLKSRKLCFGVGWNFSMLRPSNQRTLFLKYIFWFMTFNLFKMAAKVGSFVFLL